eukprot:5325528-Amphidinium_carterae.2
MVDASLKAPTPPLTLDRLRTHRLVPPVGHRQTEQLYCRPHHGQTAIIRNNKEHVIQDADQY